MNWDDGTTWDVTLYITRSSFYLCCVYERWNENISVHSFCVANKQHISTLCKARKKARTGTLNFSKMNLKDNSWNIVESHGAGYSGNNLDHWNIFGNILRFYDIFWKYLSLTLFGWATSHYLERRVRLLPTIEIMERNCRSVPIAEVSSRRACYFPPGKEKNFGATSHSPHILHSRPSYGEHLKETSASKSPKLTSVSDWIRLNTSALDAYLDQRKTLDPINFGTKKP